MNKKIKKFIKQIYGTARQIFWPLLNFYGRLKYKSKKDLMVNLGCSDVRINGFVNADIRYTSAVDITLDLKEIKFFKNNVKCFFSNAFFEHLYRNDRLAHLKSLMKSLQPAGFVCYIGIPYFKVIARAFLNKERGTIGKVFNLYNVYRYTHGDPDRMPNWYIHQLHKSLFDEEELTNLLTNAGFTSFVIFCYAFPDDINPVKVNLGFYAEKQEHEKIKTRQSCFNFLKQFDRRFILINSLEFLNE